MLQSFNRLFAGGDRSEEEVNALEDVTQMDIEKIVPNQYQPRVVFDEERISELAQTLKTHGMIQPIVVRKKDDEQYELIAGERRFRAAQMLEWKTVPAIIRDMSDTETASVALIENIQRENLSVIEEANAYVQLLEMHELTQEALAQRLGKSQSTIANRIRLLSLPDEVQGALMNKDISERHARALLKLPDDESKLHFLKIIIEQTLTVRETDDLIKKHLQGDKKKKKPKAKTQFVSKDIRIATNTIRRSLDLIEKTGIDVETEEEDLGDYYQITIKVKK